MTRAHNGFTVAAYQRAIRAPKDELLGALDATLGTAFNLAMARALRAKGVLFVEGKDMRILRVLGKRLGYQNLDADGALAVIPINGYSNWESVEHFKWFLDNFLESSVKSMVLLDRDYRTQEQANKVVARLAAVGVGARVWKKKELESYLLSADVVAPVSGAPVALVASLLDAAIEETRDEIFARVLSELQISQRSQGAHFVSVTTEGLKRFDQDRANESYRYDRCPPKQVISAVNSGLQSHGRKAVSFEALARMIPPADVSDEMRNVLGEIDALAAVKFGGYV